MSNAPVMQTMVVSQEALEAMMNQVVVMRELKELMTACLEAIQEARFFRLEPALLTETEAAAYIGMSPQFLRKGRSNGDLKNRTPQPGFKEVGGKIKRYERTELDRWIKEDCPGKGGGYDRRKAA